MPNEQKKKSKYPCPCCGFQVFTEGPGSYDICPICFWEDDISQLRFPYTTGANHVSLIQAQKNFKILGACEQRLLQYVRKVLSGDVKDQNWRLVDETIDNIEIQIKGKDYGITYPSDLTVLYYWMPKYWRKKL